MTGTLLTLLLQADSLPPRQRFVAVALAVAILVVILELVRRRKLREEHSLLWVVTGVLLLVLATQYELLLWVTRLFGAALPTSTLFFGGLIFLILVSLQFSVRLSTMTRRLKDLNQRLALLEHQLNRHAAHGATDAPGPPPNPGKENPGENP